ncbi:GmrSD restriction endonuclease domain-containing protein [Methylotenera sp. N17]|uniref:GmrSD restriction endonuclease domain-containing protein n=1 Tax=Methylotenera sp. N17 TaxID=1502761 RepID=UPI00068C0E5C|nr:DUF262 domain-containing protein [Methylotenera sp. N17]
MALDATDELIDAETKLQQEDDNSETPPSDIVAFNELRSCADLTRMDKTNQLIIKPEFQRDIVWPNTAQTRFIDSLVKQLPIPSMCISLDYKTEKRLVIDGLQRISTVIKFLTDDKWRLSELEDIDPRISGRTALYIKDKYPDIYGRIENLTIPITVLRCDYSKKSHLNYLFTIFHRLNTGGNKLSNQEIRNCIFSGGFNDLLKKIVNLDITKNLFVIEPDKKYRYSFEELILRTFCFAETYEIYTGRLAKFLNDYMQSKKNVSEFELLEKELRLINTFALLNQKILDGRPLPKLSKATTEALLVGIYNNYETLIARTDQEVLGMYEALRNDQLFSVDNLKEGLAEKDKVIGRIRKSIQIFS